MTTAPRVASHKPIRRRAPGRPHQAKADALQEIYLQAALEVFLEHGYGGASMEAIARRAKASKVTLYRHFDDKAGLFRSAMHHAISKVRQKLHSPPNSDEAPEKVLKEMIWRLHTALTDPEYLAILRMVIAETERFPELGEILLSDDRYMLEPVTTYLKSAAAKGQLHVPDPDAATMQLAALAIGGTRFLIKKPRTDAESREKWSEAILRFVLAAWRQAEPLPGEDSENP